MTRPPKPTLGTLGEVLAGALWTRGPRCSGAEGSGAEKAFPDGSNSQKNNAHNPASVLLLLMLPPPSPTTEELYRHKAEGITVTWAKLSYESFEAKGSA